VFIKGTGAEIYAQCGGQVDMVVAGAGTGGTIAGIGRKLKPLLPNVKVSIELLQVDSGGLPGVAHVLYLL